MEGGKSTRRRRTLPHVPALDGLRGAAVVGVLLYHGRHLEGGFLGVDLFFVLSGYLITTLLLLEWANDRRIDLGHFWARRARRLLPALFGLLVVAALWAKFVALPVDLESIRGDGFATLFYVANWHSIAIGQDYFQASLAPSPLEHVWSLAIEEQFYVLWPLVVIGFLKLRNRPDTIFWVSVVVAVTSAVTMVGLHAAGSVSENSLYLGTHTRVAAIGMGAALAAWRVGHRRTRSVEGRYGIEAVGIIGALVLAVAWTSLSVTDALLYRGGLAVCGLAATAVIAAVSMPESPVLGRVLAVAPMRWLGLISYGLYLWHWPVYLYLTERRTGLSGWPLFALQVSVSVAIAIVSYHLLERPIREGALKAPAVRFATPAAVALVCAALLLATAGAVSVGGPDAAAVANGALRGDGPAGSPTVMVFGDSVAGELASDGIAPRLDEFGVTLESGIFYACNPMASVGRLRDQFEFDRTGFSTDCTKGWRMGMQQKQPDVAVVMLGGAPVYTVEVGGKRYSPCDPEYRKAQVGRLISAYKDLRSTGVPVVVVTNVRNDDGRFRAIVPDDIDDRVDCTNGDYRKAAAAVPGVQVLDLDRYICPPGEGCTQKVDGGPLRADGIHFQDAGARYVADWLVPEVKKAIRRG